MQDKLRIKNLVEAAIAKCGGSSRVAEILDVHRQRVSNWKNGHRLPSLEEQAELAEIAGLDMEATVLQSLVENAEGARKERFQRAYLGWSDRRAELLEGRKPKAPKAPTARELGLTLGVGNDAVHKQ